MCLIIYSVYIRAVRVRTSHFPADQAFTAPSRLLQMLTARKRFIQRYFQRLMCIALIILLTYNNRAAKEYIMPYLPHNACQIIQVFAKGRNIHVKRLRQKLHAVYNCRYVMRCRLHEILRSQQTSRIIL